VASNATNSQEVGTEDPVIFNHRDKESKFTAEAQQMTNSQTLRLMALLKMTKRPHVVEEVVVIARRNLVTTKLDVVGAAAEVTDNLRSMTKRRSRAGPRESTNPTMKARSHLVVEAVAENAILKGTTMMRTKLLVKMATKVLREAAAATNANTTRVANT